MAFGAESSSEGLWEKIRVAYDRANAIGAASRLATSTTRVLDEETGVNFIIRVAEALKAKPVTPRALDSRCTPPAFNPFSPYDENLWVEHLSDTHTLLLNKYNLVAHHVLVVTRRFESQDDPLTLADVQAVLKTLQAFPSGGLAFFNHGPLSGMSQPHKHVQVVPLPLDDTTPEPSLAVPAAGAATHGARDGRAAAAAIGPGTDAAALGAVTGAAVGGVAAAGAPIGPVVLRALEGAAAGAVVAVEQLPFVAFAARLDPGSDSAHAHAAYEALVHRAGVEHAAALVPSYNLLMTLEWMLLVPRGRELWDGLGCNALGFAGTVFVRTQDEFEQLIALGPMRLLEHVGCSSG